MPAEQLEIRLVTSIRVLTIEGAERWRRIIDGEVSDIDRYLSFLAFGGFSFQTIVRRLNALVQIKSCFQTPLFWSP